MATKKPLKNDGLVQLPLWAPESNWVPTPVSDLPSWAGTKRVSIDTETKDPYLKELGPSVRRGGFIAGISLALEDGPSYYLPIRHEGGGNLPEDQVIGYMKEQCRNFTGEIVGANLSYDLDYLMHEGITYPNVKYFRDVQIADPLIYELHSSYSLQKIAERLGLPGKDETLLREAARAFNLDPKGGMWRLHSKYVGPYAIQDAVEPLRILRKQELIIDEKELWDVYNLESKVLPVLVKMRRRGVRIDLDKLAQVERWSAHEEADALSKVKHLTGVRIDVGDVWKAEVMAAALEAIGVNVPKTATGASSVRKDILDGIDHPVADALQWARKVNKVRTTFAASVRRYMVNGRIHCSFNQLPIDKGDASGESDGVKGARYGRLSCEDPNLQQQPSRDEFAPMWRSIYLPEEGKLWSANDYSQQEPRMLIHFAELCGYPRATEAAQKYRDDPNTDNHQMMAEMSGVGRKQAKELFLGKCYGMGGPKLCRKLGLPTRWAVFYAERARRPDYYETAEEAYAAARKTSGARAREVAGLEGQQIIDRFDNQLPFVKSLAEKCQQTAEKRGFIKTLSGRRCNFPTDDYGQYDWCHKALNRLIQGSSADQTKSAMVAVDAAGFNLMLQVHDELAFSVDNREEGMAAAEIMSNCVPLNVPSKVDVEVGPSWGEAE